MVHGLAEQARRLHGQGRHAEATDALRAWLATAPDDAEARALLVRSLLELGDAAEALHHCRALVASRPDDAEHQRLLGDALFRLGRVAEASDALARAGELEHRPTPDGLDTSAAAERDGWFADELEGEPTRVHGGGAPLTPPAPSSGRPALDLDLPATPLSVRRSVTPAAPRIRSELPFPPAPPLRPATSAPPRARGAAAILSDEPPSLRAISSANGALPLGSPSLTPLGSPSLPAAPLGAPSLTPLGPRSAEPPPSLPTVASVPPPAGRLRLAFGVVGAFAAAGVAAGALWAFGPWSAAIGPEADAAARQARLEGSRGAVAHAVELLARSPGRDARALRTSLLAALRHQHGEGDLGSLEAAVRQGGGFEHGVGRAWVALARADYPGAAEALAAVPPPPEEAVAGRLELAVIRAELAAAQGDWAGARAALSGSTDVARAPRAQALLARATGHLEGPAAGLALLPQGTATPSLALVRAELLEEGVEAAASGRGLALDLLAGTAAGHHERVRAHLVVAKEAARRGASATAATHVEQAWAPPHPPRPGFAADVAETALRAGRPDVAATAIAEVDPRRDGAERARALRFDVALARGDLEAASLVLDDLPLAESARPEWVRRRGLLAEAAGRDRDAQRAFEELAGHTDWLAESRVHLAALAVATGRPEAALGLLAEAVEREPGHVEAVVRYVDHALAAGDRAAADAAVRAAVEASPFEDLRLGVARAQVWLAEGRVEDAVGALRAVAAERPDDLAAQLAWGRAARLSGNVDAATAAFERALAAAPRDPQALEARLDLALASRDLERARAFVDGPEAARLPPALAARARAAVAAFEGRGAEALDAARAAAERFDEPRLHTAAGELAFQARDLALAQRHLERAVASPDAPPEASLGLAHVRILRGDVGAAARQLGDAQRAAEALGRGDELEPSFALARAWIHLQVGNLMDADREARRAVTLDADDGRAHFGLARVVIERGEDPRPHLERAVAGHHPPPEAHALLALELRQGQEACRHAAIARRRVPGFEADRLRALSCE